MKKFVSALAVCAAALAAPVHAQPAAGAAPASAAAAAASAMADGEVRKVDKSARKITLKHGEIRSLQMPPMTMVFKVREGVALDAVQAGDKVRFKAEQVGGAIVVTEIEPAR